MNASDWLLLTVGIAWTLWSGYWFLAAGATNKTKSSEGFVGRAQHLLPLTAGFILIFHGGRHPLIYGPLFHSLASRIAGAVMTIAGLTFAVWGRVHLGKYWSGIITLKEGHRLIRTGPYRLVRHPLYTGFLTGVLGSALVAATGDALAGFAVMLIAYLIKIRREEALLTREFGEEYLQFKREVPQLVPFAL